MLLQQLSKDLPEEFEEVLLQQLSEDLSNDLPDDFKRMLSEYFSKDLPENFLQHLPGESGTTTHYGAMSRYGMTRRSNWNGVETACL